MNTMWVTTRGQHRMERATDLLLTAVVLILAAWWCWQYVNRGLVMAETRWPVGLEVHDPNQLLRFMVTLACIKLAAVVAALLAGRRLLQAAFVLVGLLLDRRSTQSADGRPSHDPGSL